MIGRRAATAQSRIAIEDIVLTILGLGAGPLLWWMGQLWQQVPTASSTQTLEYWIAFMCGILGGALCVMWAIFLFAGLGLIVGIKTRSTVVTYWSEVFTPKFLRRLIVSIFGAQLVLSSQAVAAPIDEDTLSRAPVEQQEPFMPYVHTPAEHAPAATSAPTSTPRAHPTNPTPTHTSSVKISSSPTASSPPTVEPRQHSEVPVTSEPVTPSASTPALVPTPRQTSTIEVEHTLNADALSTPQDLRHTYTPKQPVPSPYIAGPNQSRTTEDPTVVVRAGDCLWDIARHELGADATLFQVDRRWRQWWRHNQAIIGDNPHELRPGTVLESPPFTE